MLGWGHVDGNVSLKYCWTATGSKGGRFWFVDSLYPLSRSVAIASRMGNVVLETDPPGNSWVVPDAWVKSLPTNQGWPPSPSTNSWMGIPPALGGRTSRRSGDHDNGPALLSPPIPATSGSRLAGRFTLPTAVNTGCACSSPRRTGESPRAPGSAPAARSNDTENRSAASERPVAPC